MLFFLFHPSHLLQVMLEKVSLVLSVAASCSFYSSSSWTGQNKQNRFVQDTDVLHISGNVTACSAQIRHRPSLVTIVLYTFMDNFVVVSSGGFILSTVQNSKMSSSSVVKIKDAWQRILLAKLMDDGGTHFDPIYRGVLSRRSLYTAWFEARRDEIRVFILINHFHECSTLMSIEEQSAMFCRSKHLMYQLVCARLFLPNIHTHANKLCSIESQWMCCYHCSSENFTQARCATPSNWDWCILVHMRKMIYETFSFCVCFFSHCCSLLCLRNFILFHHIDKCDIRLVCAWFSVKIVCVAFFVVARQRASLVRFSSPEPGENFHENKTPWVKPRRSRDCCRVTLLVIAENSRPVGIPLSVYPTRTERDVSGERKIRHENKTPG